MEHSTILKSLLTNKNIIIVHPYFESEVLDPKFGGTRLIYEQFEFLKETGHKVDLISLADVGSVTSLFYRFNGQLQRKRMITSMTRSSEKKRWWLHLGIIVTEQILIRLDFLFRVKLRKKIKNLSDDPLVIYHYPYSFMSLIKATSDCRAIRVVYEHNVEWKFLGNSIGNSQVAKTLIMLCKQIEINSLRHADYVICTNTKDRITLVDEGIDSNKITTWIPIRQKLANVNESSISKELQERFVQKFTVGFIGSNFGPNISSVTNIIRIAQELLDTKIIFLIIGNISKAFEHEQLPTNVIFTGYIEDLDPYLSICKAFVNPKVESATGIEIKMFDYLKFSKPIIGTETGCHGFEHFDNVIVTSVENIATILRRMANAQGHQPIK